MKKIICEYCRSQIDISEDNKCPNCGATFENNETYKYIKEHSKKHAELDIKEREIDIENKKLMHENVNKVTGTFSKVFIIVFVTSFIFIILIFFITFKNVFNTKNDNNLNINNSFDFNNEENIDNNVIVGLNEFGVTNNYKVKVDSYEIIEKYPFNIRDGYKIVTFHFIVENVSGGDYMLLDNINCVVDGIAQTDKYDYDNESLPFRIAKDLTVHGNKAFEVPMDATSYDIKFGDYVTIHIEL